MSALRLGVMSLLVEEKMRGDGASTIMDSQSGKLDRQ